MIKCSNKSKDHMLTVTAAVWITFKKDGIAYSENRSVSVVLTQENIASSTRCVYSTISSALTVMEDDNPTYDFKRVPSLDLIALARRMTVDSVPRIIKTMTLEGDSSPILVIEGELAPRSDNSSGRKKNETDANSKERRCSVYFIPRDHEIANGVTTDSHPYLAANFESDRVDVLKKKRAAKTTSSPSNATTDQIVKDKNPVSSFAARKKIDGNQHVSKPSSKLADSEKPEPTERKRKPSSPTIVTSGEKNGATLHQRASETTLATVREKTTFETGIFETRERDVEQPKTETRDRHPIASVRPIERSKSSSSRYDENNEQRTLDHAKSKSESHHAKKRKRTTSTSSCNDASATISKNQTFKDEHRASSSPATARKKTIDSEHRSKASKPADNETTGPRIEKRKSATTEKNSSLQQPGETFDPPELKTGRVVANADDRSASVRPDSKSRHQDDENDKRRDSTTSGDGATKKRKLSSIAPTIDSTEKPASSSVAVETLDDARHHQRDNDRAPSKLADEEKPDPSPVDERKKNSPSSSPRIEEKERTSFSKSKETGVKTSSEQPVRCDDDAPISTTNSSNDLQDSQETSAAIASIVVVGDEIELDYDEDVALPSERCPKTPTRPTSSDASVDGTIANACTLISDTSSSEDEDDDDEKRTAPLPGLARIFHHPKLNVETLSSVETCREKRRETEDSDVGSMPPPKEIHFEIKPSLLRRRKGKNVRSNGGARRRLLVRGNNKGDPERFQTFQARVYARAHRSRSMLLFLRNEPPFYFISHWA